MRQLMFQDDQQFWFETLRNLGLSVYGGSAAPTDNKTLWNHGAAGAGEGT